MVAVFNSGRSLRDTFFYNENKVEEGVAKLLYAGNYPMDLERLSQKFRLSLLQRTADLAPNIKRPSVHISLNFAPDEKLSLEKLSQIATEYMEGIGFEQQPYLVYQHFDAGHPHLHILSLRVRPDGTSIDTFQIGKRLSQPTREALEIKYNLVKAKDQPKPDFSLKSAYTPKAIYGKSESRKAISIVLNAVINQYKYTSLPELNAVLGLYNVRADRGSETSQTFKNKGLLYHILDENGKAVGVPIKASAFIDKPTLKVIEAKFEANETKREIYKRAAKNAVDRYFLKATNPTIAALQNALAKEGIHTVLRQSEQGFVYGVTYVDHQNKCVFNGSSLGKTYSASGILERCGNRQASQAQQVTEQIQQPNGNNHIVPTGWPAHDSHSTQTNILNDLMQEENTGTGMPYELSGKKKRKKKRRINH